MAHPLTEFKNTVRRHFRKQCEKLGGSGEIVQTLHLTVPKDDIFGDFTTNLPFSLAKDLRMAPKKIAEALIEGLTDTIDTVEKVEVAANGFINMTMKWSYWHHVLHHFLHDEIVEKTDCPEAGERYQIEFVSANPTGPLNIVNARAGALGDCLARLFNSRGVEMHKEFLINDAGNQATILGKSLRVRIEQELGGDVQFPEWGYPGDYLIDIARTIISETSPGSSPLDLDDDVLKTKAIQEIRQGQEEDLSNFRVHYDNWFSEQTLHDSAEVSETLAALIATGETYESEGAVWLKTSAYGDEKDRVLVKNDGSTTYFLADISYHRNKINRGYTRLINIWGPDHHGHIARMKAGLQILGFDPEKLEILIAQQVNLLRDGQRVKMTKRGGEFVLMRDLLDEVGPDPARFFFINRRADSHVDFDLDLAVSQTKENPVFYIQYASARIHSIFRKAAERDMSISFTDEYKISQLTPLQEELERKLVRYMIMMQSIIDDCIVNREPHRLAYFLLDVANTYHKYQHDHQILLEEQEIREARLLLLAGVLNLIKRGLDLLGIESPEKM